MEITRTQPKKARADEPLVERFNRFINSGNLSINIASKSMGISAATLSLYLRGEYEGDTAKITKAVEQYLVLNEARTNTPRNTDTEVETRNYTLVKGLCARIHRNGRMGVCTGQAGLGKTTALKSYASEFTDVIYLEADTSVSPRELMKSLNRIINNNVTGTVNEIKNQLILRLRDTGRLIIIDQAEYLSEKALDLLRTVHDRTGVGIVLAGLPQLLSNLRGIGGVNEQLYTRISMAVELRRLPEDDVRMLVHAHLPGINGEYKVFNRLCRGNARVLNLLIENARILSGGEPISEDTIIKASNLMVH